MLQTPIDGGDSVFNNTEEVADFGSLPATGVDERIYTTLDDNKLWRWDGVAYVEVSPDTTNTSDFQITAEKGAVNGYAPLDGSGHIPSANLPSYVDDVIEVADFASLPVTGETGKIYVTIDDNKTFRWSGATYIEISTLDGATIKILYEGELDTNAYTDAEKAELILLREIMTDTNEPTGFIREFPATMGVLELSPDGTTVYRIDQNGNFTTNVSGNFADGTTFQTPATLQTTCIYPAAASGGFDIYIEGIKYNVDELQQAAYTPASGLQFCYFEVALGVPVLTTSQILNSDYFQDKPICSIVYGNITTGDKVVFADERHGIEMSGATHRYLHFTEGTKYVNGMGIEGLADGTGTYTQVASGVAYDEDIDMSPAAQSTAPFWYRIGTVWTDSADANLIAYMGTTYAYYNEDTGGGVFALTEIGNNNYTIMHFVLTNDAEFPIVKILSQSVFNSVADAQAAIVDDANNLVLTGLPTPEFLFIGSVIIDDAGNLKLLSDGNEYLDLTEKRITGSTSSSGSTGLHADLTDTATNGHPATIIDLVAPHWELTATNTEDAINELSGGKQKLSRNITIATTNYSPTVGLDNGGVIGLEGGANLEFQIFPNAMSPFPKGSKFTIFQKDAFTGTITFSIGVTINGIAGAGTLTLEQNEAYILYQVAIDEWIAIKVAEGGGGGTGVSIYSGNIAGEQIVGLVSEISADASFTATQFKVSTNTLPSGTDFIAKLYKNGVEDASCTITTAQSATNGRYITDDTTFVSGSYSENDTITVEITQVGSTSPGTNFMWSIS